MSRRYVMDLDGFYCQVNRITRRLPGAGLAVVAPIELAKLTMPIVIGYQSRSQLQYSHLYIKLIDCGVPTDYALDATESLTLALEEFILNTARLRINYTQYNYEFRGERLLEVFECLPVNDPPRTHDFWLDKIDDYYVGASLNGIHNAVH